MATTDDVINDALEHLGEPPSSGEDDTSLWVVRCTNAYAREVVKLFEGHNWNFALRKTQLAAVEPTPDGWLYGFAKPSGSKRIIKVTSSSNPTAGEIDYVDFGGRILTNSEETWLIDVDGGVVDTPGMWSALFAGALAAQIAWKVCAVTGTSDSKKEELRKMARRAVSEAKLFDAQQNGAFIIPPGEYEKARWGFSRRYNG